jgi:hypothetical protein
MFSRTPKSYAVCSTLAALLLLASCSSVRQLRPLRKNESSVRLSAGGPLAGEVKWMPIPQLGIGYNRGLLDTVLDVEAGWYVTSALYGIMHLDLGVNWRPWLHQGLRPGLMLSPKAFFLTDFSPGGFRAYPDLGVTAFWEPRDLWYLYAGVESWFELHTERTDGNKQQHHWLPAPYLGTDMGSAKWRFQVEVRMYTPNLKNTGRKITNVGIGDYGIWGVFLGVSRSFGPRASEHSQEAAE